jgi:mevalonate kinase
MLSEFQTSTHGKWILAGEHSVIRGGQAMVFPVQHKELTLHYHPSSSNLGADYTGDSGADLHLLFWSVLEHGMHLLGKSLNRLNGQFMLHSNIPIGVGMGASAALCVATARWFLAQNFIQPDALQSFATELENLFHGKSSGLDIVGVTALGGLAFQQGNITPIQQAWQPHWYLSSCGQIGMTSHCINRVQNLWETQPKKAQQIDQEMQESVSLAKAALEQQTGNPLEQLAEAIQLASHCFQQWGLVSESLQQHMLLLKKQGALAVKPTGSGGGGFVISLWAQEPMEMPGLIAV